MRLVCLSRRLAAILWLGASLSMPPSVAAVTRFVITPDDGKTLVRFDSKAPLESFGGTTRHARGEIFVDPAVLGDSISVLVEVDLATLDTGIGLRNKHMRENHLETARFPLATFRGVRIVSEHPDSLEAGRGARFEIEGLFGLHGVERLMRVPVTVTYEVTPDVARLGVECQFVVKLSDHSIPRPQFLTLKVADEQLVTFRALAVRAE